VAAEYAPFAGDLAERDESDFRARLAGGTERISARRELKADWRSVMNAPAETLVNALAMLCPFEPNENRRCLRRRAGRAGQHAFALLEMASASTGSNTVN